MESTPHIQKHSSKMRRRIIGSPSRKKDQVDSKNTEVESKKLNKNKAETAASVSFKEASAISEKRYSLRSSLNYPEQEKSQFYKSLMTPSRMKKKRRSSIHQSKFRTPYIQSAVRKTYVVEAKKKIPVAVRNKWKEDCQIMLKRQWKFCFLSSMTNFNYERKNLRLHYERALKNRILEVFPSYMMAVEFRTSSFMNQNPRQTDSLFLKVTTNIVEDDLERTSTVYECLLMKTDEVQCTKLNNVEWFPLCLYSGSETIHMSVVTWLQSSFGCYITARGRVPLPNLMFISAIWTHGVCSDKKHKSDKESQVTLRYQFRLPSQSPLDPPNNKGNVFLKLTCQTKSLSSIWAKIRDTKEVYLQSVHVEKFHEVIECWIESLTCLPKTCLHLVEFKTPCVQLSNSCRLKMNCEASFLSLLHHLIEMFMLTCHTKFLAANTEEFDRNDLSSEDETADEE